MAWATDRNDPAIHLRFITEEFKPFNYTEDGRPKGATIEILKLVWKEMGVPERPIEFLPWSRGYDMLLHKKNTVLFTTFKTEERIPLFLWAGPINKSRVCLITLRTSHAQINTLEDCSKYTVGVVADYASAFMFKKRAEAKKLETVSCIQVNIKKLISGRIDMLVFDEVAFYNTAESMGYSRDLFEPKWTLVDGETFYAFNKDTNKALVERFQHAFDKVKASPEYKEIIRRYF